MKRKPTIVVVLLSMLMFVTASAGVFDAQTASPSATPTNSPVPSPAPSATPTPASPQPPKVTGYEGRLELDDIIQVQIVNLADWAKTNEGSKVAPYLNG